MTYTFEVRKPAGWKSGELDICLAILASGGAVDMNFASKLLPLAEALALARCNGDIVGLAAVKTQRKDYIRRIVKKGHFNLPANSLEVGYVAVSQEHHRHGIGSALVRDLISLFEGTLFATTYDPRMLHILDSGGFTVCGKTWQSRSGERTFLLIRDFSKSDD